MDPDAPAPRPTAPGARPECPDPGRRASPERGTPLADRVARHYDVLDPWYRRLWGEHLHHGLWRTGRETVDEATQALVARVAEEAGIRPGHRVVDLGSGYGATARLLARRWGARVTAVTVSPVQHAHAVSVSPPVPGVEYRNADFASAALPEGAFDAVVAIESLSHMDDLDGVLAEACRVLRPGGRLVGCIWLGGRTDGWRSRFLAEPIVREGRLARLAPASRYREAMVQAGFEPTSFHDLSRRVRRTWWVCARRVVGRVLRDPEARRLVARGGEGVFAWTVPRLLAGYWTGTLRYGLLGARRPE